jgi:hypothetical protein
MVDCFCAPAASTGRSRHSCPRGRFCRTPMDDVALARAASPTAPPSATGDARHGVGARKVLSQDSFVAHACVIAAEVARVSAVKRGVWDREFPADALADVFVDAPRRARRGEATRVSGGLPDRYSGPGPGPGRPGGSSSPDQRRPRRSDPRQGHARPRSAQSGSTVTTASAATPSARPMKPIPSPRVALTLTWASGSSSAAARRSRI